MAAQQTEAVQPLLADQANDRGGWDACALHNDATKTGEQRKAQRKLITAVVLCLVFMVVELVGGYFASSLAIMSDAAHLLSDVAGFGVSLFALQVTKMKSPNMTYGFGRAEVLGALLSTLTIWMVTGVLVYEAIQRIIKPEDVDGKLMFIIASIGVVVNIALFFVLGEMGHSHGPGGHDHGHDHGHGHGHGAEHSHDEEAGHNHSHSHDHDHDHDDHDGHGKHESNGGNMNVRSAWLHAIGDLLQNIGVMIAAGLIWWKPEWKIADPIATLLFSVLVVWTTKALMTDIVNTLMQRVPGGFDPAEIAAKIGRVEGVERVHDMHLWSLTTGVPVMSVHIDVSPEADCSETTAAVREQLKTLGIEHSTIQSHH
mmetsp:Transcript_28614/g.80609  ORF Transcript_28614/g.80609 Transcript_28614/m.80609 type:complete len:370 (+) Transcript_28614:108-1217(+)